MFREYALNHFVANETLDTLAYFIVTYVLTVLVAGVCNYISCYYAMHNEVSINRDLRRDAFNHLQNLSFSYFNQNSVGYNHARVMSDTSRIGSLMSWTMMDSVWHFSYLVGAIVVMFIKNARLALLVCAIVPVAALLFAVFQGKLTRLNREIREMNSKITGDFNEGITGAKTVKTLVVEDKMNRDFVKDTEEMRHKSVRAAHFRALFASTITFASSFALAIVLWRGGMLGKNEIGTFAVFMSYAMGMMETVRWIIDVISDVITTQVNIERFHNLMTTEPDVKDTPEVIEKYGDAFNPKKENWEEISGDIEFDDVSFKYPDAKEYLLEDISFKAEKGQTVACHHQYR